MRYNPDIHSRRSIRLKNYDYSLDGAYFVTLCTFDRGCYFEQFEQLRLIVEDRWHGITERFSAVMLDEYVIMPNHFHGIIIICRDTPCGYPPYGYPDDGHPQGAPLRKANVGDVVGAFKSLCVNEWLKVIKDGNINARGRFWQDNYYEHIIRNNGEMERIRRYIADNPLRWELDRENPGFDKSRQSKQPESWMV